MLWVCFELGGGGEAIKHGVFSVCLSSRCICMSRRVHLSISPLDNPVGSFKKGGEGFTRALTDLLTGEGDWQSQLDNLWLSMVLQ